jgi:AcrR family transcriptional regulator
MVKSSDVTVQLNQDSAEKRILASAREEFIGRGLRGARIQAIADRVGVNKALVHYYFRTKEKLYDAVLQDTMTTVISTLQQEFPENADDTDLRSLIRRIVTAYITTFQKNPNFPRFIIRELADGGARLPRLIDAAILTAGDFPRLIHRLLVAGMEQGLVRPTKPVHFLLNLLGMCIFTFIARPILNLVNERAPLGIVFDEVFFQDRIDAIVDMACGIFKEQRER